MIEQNQLKIRKSEIERALYELDTKRVRAMCEPSVKDDATGETWLEYYNNQAIELRNELNQLERKITEKSRMQIPVNLSERLSQKYSN